MKQVTLKNNKNARKLDTLYKKSALMITTGSLLLGTALLSQKAAAEEELELLENALHKNAMTYVDQFQKIIQNDSSLKKDIRQLQNELKNINQSNKDPKIAFKLSVKEIARYQKTLDQVYSLAKFDELKYHKEQELLVAKYNAKSKKKAKISRKGKLSFTLIEIPDFDAPTEGAEISLSRPFPLREEDINGDGSASINPDEGSYFITADSNFFSNFTNVGGLGHFFEVPSNSRRIRVSASVPEASSTLIGTTAAGAGMGKTVQKIFVEGEAGNLCQKSKTVDTLHVYFFDSTIADKTTNVVLACEFDAPPAGQQIVIRFVGKSKVDTTFALMHSWLLARPETVRIRINPVQ